MTMKVKAIVEIEYEVDGEIKGEIQDVVVSHIAKLDGLYCSEEYDQSEDFALLMNSFRVASIEEDKA